MYIYRGVLFEIAPKKGDFGMKKFLSLLLAVMMVLSTVSFALPSAVTAVDDTIENDVVDTYVAAPEETADLADEDIWYDADMGIKLFVIDLDGDTKYTTAALSQLSARIDGSNDNVASNGLYLSAIGRVNPDYASYADTFKYSFKDGGTPTVEGTDDKYFKHTTSTRSSVMVANPFVGDGAYTLVFNHNADTEYTIHSGYTGGTVTETPVDSQWTTAAYTIDIAEQGSNDYIRMYASSAPGTYSIDDVALFYKPDGWTAPDEGGEEEEPVTETWYDLEKGTLLFNMDFDKANDGNAVAAAAYDGISLGSYSTGSGELVSGLGRLNPDVAGNYDVGFRYTTSGSAAICDENGNKYLSLNSNGSNQISLYLGNTYTKTGTYVFEYKYKLVSTGATTANNITYNTLTPVEGGTDAYTFDTWVTETATFEVSSIPSYSRVMFYAAGNYSTSDKLYLDDIKVWYYDESVDYDSMLNPDIETNDVWEDEEKGTKLFTIDFTAKDDKKAIDSSSWDTIKDRLDNNPSNGELVSDIGRINPDVDGSEYRISFNYIDNSKTEIITEGDNKYLSVASDASHGDISLYLGGFYDGEGKYIIETSYKFVQKGTNTVDRIRYETLGLEYMDSSYLSRGEWVDLSETHEHASCTHGNVNRTRFTTEGYNNNPFSADDRIYIDNITVYYKAPATEEPEEPVEDEWANTAKGYKLFMVDFETKNDGTAVETADVSAITSGRADSSPASAGVAVSSVGRVNPNYTVNTRINVKAGSGASIAGTDNKYLTLSGSGDSLIFGQIYVGDGTYIFEFNTNTVAYNATRGSYNPDVVPTATAVDGTWFVTTHTAAGVTESSSTSCSSYGTDNIRFHCSTAPTMYDNITVYYQPTGWTPPSSGGGDEPADEWTDEEKGTLLYTVDFATKNDGSAVASSDISSITSGRLDGSATAGVAVSGVGRVNPVYASKGFRIGLKDAGTASMTSGSLTATTSSAMSLYFRNSYVGAGQYTFVFDYNTASDAAFYVHSGYTFGTLTSEEVDSTWTRITYVVDDLNDTNYISNDTYASDYLRMLSSKASAEGKFMFDNISVYYKNTKADVTVRANGNANVSDTVVSVDAVNGDKIGNVIAQVDTSASTKYLLGASLTANGELLGADYIVKPSEVTEIYLIWGGDIVVDDTPWYDEGYGTLLFNVNWDGTLSSAPQTRWADVRAAGAVTNPDWKCFEKCYFMWGTEDIGGSTTWTPANSPLIVSEANGNRYYTEPHDSTYNSWSIYSTFDGDWANWADTAGVFTITYKIKTIGDITVNNLFIDPQTVKDHATVKQNIRLYSTERPDSSGWTTVTYQVDLSDYDVSEGESLGHVLLYAQTNESSAVSGAYICYDDVKVYYKPSKVNVTLKPGTNLEVNETTVEVSSKGMLVSDLIALVNTEDTTMLATGITSEDGSKKYALSDTVVLDADTTFFITWETNNWMDAEKGMLIQRADFEGTFATEKVNRWPAATALGATINPDYNFGGIMGLQFTTSELGIALDASSMWIPAEYAKTENGNTYFEAPTANNAYGASQQLTNLSMYAMGSGASQYQYQTAGTYTITGKVKYGTDIQNAIFEVRPNLYNGDGGLSGGYNYQFTDFTAGEWNEFSVTWSTAENSEYGLGSVQMYLFYDILSSKSTIAYDDIMLYFKPFTAEVTLRANNNPVAKDVVLSNVSTSGITVDELISNIRTPLGGMDLVGLAYDKAGTNMLEGTVVVGGDARFFMIWKESELDPNAPVSENVNAIRTDDPIGMRFRSYMTSTVYEGATQVGWVATRYDMLEAKDINPYDFYMDTDVTKIYAYNKDTDGTDKVFNTDDVNTYITAVLYNIPEAHYQTTLVARPFTVVDGVTYYGYPIERSICDVAEAIRDGGYAGCSNDQIIYINKILAVCGKEEGTVIRPEEEEEEIVTLTLQKDENEDFVILNITDPQMSDSEWQGEAATVLRNTIQTLVTESNPDLITVSGDISVAGFCDVAYTNFADLIDSYGIPWTVVWGNHDNESGATIVQNVVDEYKTYDNFIYNEGPEELGNGNFVIEIQQNGEPVHALVMMDTHNKMDYNGTESWGALTEDQLAWYEKQIKALQKRGCNESSIIAHIPIKAFEEAYNAAYDSSTGTWRDGYEAFGVNHESVCCHPVDFGAFDLIKSLGSTKLYLCGHDHYNCSSILYEGVRLTYALKTGIGNYYHEDLNGGTVVEIDSEGKTNVYHKYVEA